MTVVVILFLFHATPQCLTLKTSDEMKIYINNKETEISSETLEQLANELNLPEQGVAMAVGTTMVQRTQWAETQLKEGDSIIVIKAACGG